MLHSVYRTTTKCTSQISKMINVNRVMLIRRGRLSLILLLWLRVRFGLILIVRLWLLWNLLDESSVLRRVVRAAATALHPQDVERHRAVGLTVITYNL